MTQEDKELLLKDLCARLPYGLQIHIINDEYDDGFQSGEFDNTLRYHHLEPFVCDRIEIKPYLRPMSSLVGKELDECRATCKYRQVGQSVLDCATPETIDYLISHHFDYRGLIEKGLALEVPEDMYKTE